MASGRLALFKGRTIGGTQIGSFTLNANFSGLGGVFAQNDEGAAAAVVTVNGTVAGLTGVNPNSVGVGLKVYVAGQMNIRDLPSQLSYESIGVTTCSFVVNNTTAATTYPTICVINTLDGGAATHVLKSNGFAISFGDATNGSLRRTSGSGAGTLTFVLGGTSAASELNTMLYGTTATTGPVALRKDDGNTWVLAGNNSAAASTTINGGALRATNASAFGGAVTMGNSGVVLELANNITVGNATNINAVGTIRNVSGNNSLTGALTLAGTTTVESQSGTLTLNSGTSITGAGQPLTFSGAGNHTVTSVIATTTGTVTKNGAGTTTLNGANSFSGAITHNAGVIAANSITASGNNSLGTGTSYTMTGAGTLRYTGSTPATLSKATVSVPASGAVFENNGTGNWTVSSLTAANAGTVLGLAGSNAGYNKLSPASTPANLVGFTKTGAGRWISTLNVNPASGSTAVNAGTLVASNSNGTSKLFGYDVTVASGAMIQTGSDAVGQAGKCAYNNLTFNGAVGTPARIRIGGSVVNPAIYMTGTLTIPAGGMTWNLAGADVFKTPGTYTLVEFGPSGSMSGSVSNITVTNPPTGRSVVAGSLTYNSGTTPKTITVQIA